MIVLALALAGTGSGSAVAAATGPVEFAIAYSGPFTVWYAEGGICSPDPGPHWQMSSNERHAGVGSVFNRIGRISCAAYYVHHFEMYGEHGGRETRLCAAVLRAGRLQLTSGSSSRCVLSRGARFLTIHDR
jgi:hypothetical protein